MSRSTKNLHKTAQNLDDLEEWVENIDEISDAFDCAQYERETLDTKTADLWEEIDGYLRDNYARDLCGRMAYSEFYQFIDNGN